MNESVNKRISEQEQDWIDQHCFSRNFTEAVKAWATWLDYENQVRIKRPNAPKTMAQQKKSDALFLDMRNKLASLSLAEAIIMRNIEHATER